MLFFFTSNRCQAKQILYNSLFFYTNIFRSNLLNVKKKYAINQGNPNHASLYGYRYLILYSKQSKQTVGTQLISVEWRNYWIAAIHLKLFIEL